MSTRRRFVLATTLVLGFAHGASAVEWEFWKGHPLEIHGLASQGFVYTTRDNWLTFHSSAGDLDFNEFIVNGRLKLSDNWQIGAQVISRDFGYMVNQRVELDWAFLEYDMRDWLGFRLGRFKIPFGLQGETQDFDVVRTSVFLPIYSYNPVFRDLFTHVDGVDAFGTVDLGDAGFVDYTLYFGTITVSKDGSLKEYVNVNSTLECPNDWSADYVWGFGLRWRTPLEGLSLNTTFYALRDMSTDRVKLPTGRPTGPVYSSAHFQKALEMCFGFEFARGKSTWTGEVYRWDTATILPEVLRNGRHGDGIAVYLKWDYDWSKKFSTAITLNAANQDIHDFPHDEGADRQGNLASFAARYNINDHWLVKGEIMYLDGRPHMEVRNNLDDQGLTEIGRNRWLFAFKSTLHF